VTVTVLDGSATAEIADDGCGGASSSSGSRLRGLADRLEAIGGSLALESEPDCGTVVRARAPLGPSDDP